MARLARDAFMYDGCYAHVISRSIRGYKVFHDRIDFKVFRDLLLKEKGEGDSPLKRDMSM